MLPLQISMCMVFRHLSTILFFLAFGAFSVTAQTTMESSEKDPFINDPFFSKPMEEFLKTTPAEPVDSSSTEIEPKKKPKYMRRVQNEGLDYGGYFEAGPYSSNPLYTAYPSLPMLHFNRVNGLFLGVRAERMQWYNYGSFLGIGNIHPHGMIGYSVAREEWQYEIGGEKHFGKNRRLIIGGEYYNAVTSEDVWRLGTTENSISSLLIGYDFLDYYKQEGWGLYALARSFRFFEGGVSYNVNQFSSVDQASEYHMFGKDDHYRLNPPIDFISGTGLVDTLSTSGLTISGVFNPKNFMLTQVFTFAISGKIEMVDPSFGDTDYEYTKFVGEIISYVNFEPGSILKHRLMVGSITGDAPWIKEFNLGGPGSMRAIPYKSMPTGSLSGNKMVLSTTELQFGSPNYGYGGWTDFDDFYLSFFLDSGWINNNSGFNKRFSDGFDDFAVSEFVHNGGIGLGTNFIRAEIAWDLQDTSVSPVIWIRFNPTF